MLLDAQRPLGELEDLVVGQRALAAQLRRHGLQRRPARRVDHALLLGADGLPHQRPMAGAQRVLVHVELVGHHLPLHDGLAQAVAGSDQDHAAMPGFGIEREEHAGRRQVGADHLLHADAERDLQVIEPHVGAIADGPRGEEAGETAAHRIEHLLLAADVEIRVLLAGEAGAGQIFRGGRRAHRHVGVADAVADGERLVRGGGFVGDFARQLGFDDEPAELRAALDQAVHVVLADPRQQLADALVQARAGDEVPVRFGRDGESVGHLDAERRQLTDHLAQRRDLPSHQPHIAQAHFRKPADKAHAQTSAGQPGHADGEKQRRVINASPRRPAPRRARAPPRPGPSAGRRRSACSCGSARRGGCGACRGSRRRTRRGR